MKASGLSQTCKRKARSSALPVVGMSLTSSSAKTCHSSMSYTLSGRPVVGLTASKESLSKLTPRYSRKLLPARYFSRPVGNARRPSFKDSELGLPEFYTEAKGV